MNESVIGFKQIKVHVGFQSLGLINITGSKAFECKASVAFMNCWSVSVQCVYCLAKLEFGIHTFRWGFEFEFLFLPLRGSCSTCLATTWTLDGQLKY